MTTEELCRCAQIARDQYRREMTYWWAQAISCLGAGGGLIVTARDLILWGNSRATVLGLGLAWLLSYWPYRSFKTRRLWRRHMAAVEAELSRRGEAAPADGDGGTCREGTEGGG